MEVNKIYQEPCLETVSRMPDMIAKPILAGCPKGGIIYDPFMGTGSTAEAAIRAGRNFIGSEMSAEYCKIAEKRIKPFLMQTALSF